MIKLFEIHLAERIHWGVEWRRKFLQVSLRTEQPKPEKCIRFIELSFRDFIFILSLVIIIRHNS